MQTLLVDLGNSRWKMAVASGTAIGAVSYGGYDDLGNFESTAEQLADSVGCMVLASVVNPNVANDLVAILSKASKAEVWRIGTTDQMPGVVPGYTYPDQLGVDRLLAMVAARAQTSQPLVVVDVGTAVTIDWVDADGFHLGGVILPGSGMARTCLLSHTSIPRDEQIDPAALLGRDTPTAVALGARYAVAGIVERFTSGTAALFPGQQTQIFLGGGDAEMVAELLPETHTRLNELVLHGLAVVAAHRGL